MKKILTIILLLIPSLVFAGNKLEDSLSIGQKAPDFKLPTAYGKSITLSDEIEKGPVVLSFYRGGWCPICNDQLYSFQENLEEIKKLGGQLIAISPETPSHAQKTAIKNHLKFEVVSDNGNKIAKEYGILWEVPKEGQDDFTYWLENSTGKTLEDYNANETFELPVPATFVIDTEGVVHYAFKDKDYTKRADLNDVLDTLKKLKK